MIETLLALFIALAFYYSFFIFSIFRGLGKLDNTNDYELTEFVTVIIPFRNEKDNILRCLNSIESQSFSKDKFEVIFVNDNSTDNSVELLKNNITSENIKIVNFQNNNLKRGHKKAVIQYGINNSSGEIIVTTDADCFHGKNWLKSLIECFDEKTGFVSGSVKFEKSDSIFGQLQILEFAGLVLAGAGLIGNKTPIICNGANLAFRRSVFYEINGYDDIMHLSSGDDDLLMQKFAYETDSEIQFCINKEATVYTSSHSTLSGFLEQRKRWASKTLYYKSNLLISKVILLVLFYFSLILQPILGLFLDEVFFISLLFSISAKLLFEFLVIQRGAKLLFDKSIMKLFLLAEILHIPYSFFTSILGYLGNFNWKDRELER